MAYNYSSKHPEKQSPKIELGPVILPPAAHYFATSLCGIRHKATATPTVSPLD